ncbi:MAG: hypothetical protein ACLVIG_06995 [Sutterella wadsworthensis]
MAGNIIDSLLVKIGLDSEQLKDGLDQAAQGIDNFARGAERSGEAVDRLAAHATKSGLLLGNVSDDVAERILEIGSSGQKAALAAGRAMDSLGKQVGAIGEKIMALGAPLLAAFGGTALFQSFVQDGNALAILSDRLGVSAQKIDAWAKANEDAGGSQEAFKGALENFILTTGKGEKAFFEMGDHIKGLSQRQAEYFLQSQGLSADAAAVFLKYRDNAEEAAKAFEGVAFTDEQVKLAREFNRQWRNFTNQASSLGGVLLTAVMPPLTAVIKAISSGVSYLAEHSRFVKIAAGAIAAIFGGAYLRNIVAAVKASGFFVNVFVKGMPVIKAFNAALLANPLGVLIAAAVAASVVIDDFAGFLEGDISALESFMKWCGLTSEEVDNIRQNILSFCRAVWNIPNNIKLALGEAWDVIKEMGAWFADLFHLPDAKAFTDFFAKVGDVAGSIGSTLWGGIVEGFRFIDYIADALGGLPDAFVKGFDNGISYIYEKFLAWLVEPLRSLLPESLDGLRPAADKAASAIYDALMFPIRQIKKAFEGLFGSFDAFADKAKGILGKVGSFFGFGDEAKEPAPAPQKGEVTVKADPTDKQTGGFLDGLTDKVGGWMSSLLASPTPAVAGAPAGIAASNAVASNAVNTDMKVTVQTTVNASGDGEAIGEAVAGSVHKAMGKARDYIQNSVSGVVQKG